MKIRVIGTAGQGVKTLAHIYASILADEGKNVCLSYDHGTGVRSGKVSAEIIFSDEKIENPIIGLPDLVLVLSGPKKKDLPDCELLTYEDVDFEGRSFERFGNKLFANMLALGMLVKKTGLDHQKIKLEALLPERHKEENLRAFQEGADI